MSEQAPLDLDTLNTGQRHRHVRRASEFSQFSDLDRFDLPEMSCLLEPEEGSGGGNALPSTPQDVENYDALQEELADQVINRVVESPVVVGPAVDDDDVDECAFSPLTGTSFARTEDLVHRVEELAHKVWEAGSRLVTFQALPNWLQDNDFLHRFHRPPTRSFYACFRSIFYIHTETFNIWTHLLGSVAFLVIAFYWMTRPENELNSQERFVFLCFFAGAICCLSASFLFHTVGCHSHRIMRLFSKFDYCGISLLIVCSFVPWIYYAFYCDFSFKLVYLSAVVCFGMTCMVVSLVDKFAEPAYRSLRAGLFLAFGLSGVVPAIHYLQTEGWIAPFALSVVGYLALMGALYIIGALVYAFRVPERFFPGRFDIYFHSHQVFHVLVVAAALVHYHGVTELAMYRVTNSHCSASATYIL